MSKAVLCEVREATALLTLNRPDKLNALDRATIDMLSALLADIEADERVRAVVLTGAGDKAFSAGADISRPRDDHAGGDRRGYARVRAARPGPDTPHRNFFPSRSSSP